MDPKASFVENFDSADDLVMTHGFCGPFSLCVTLGVSNCIWIYYLNMSPRDHTHAPSFSLPFLTVDRVV